MSEDDTLTISRERLTRITEALGALSVGESDLDRVRIPIQEMDEFAPFEEMFNVFIEEYAAARRENEQLNAQRLDVIERQRLAIADLSVPILDVWDDIVALPVVGMVDTQRSVEMTERLLRRVAGGGARCVIVDLTGVDVVDTSTADHLIRMIRAAQLLGSFCVITGISAKIALTLGQLDVDMRRVLTLRNLKEGLWACFQHLETRRKDRVRAPA
jgi:rsbT co-antagonist protein RsbR